MSRAMMPVPSRVGVPPQGSGGGSHLGGDPDWAVPRAIPPDEEAAGFALLVELDGNYRRAREFPEVKLGPLGT